VRILVVDDNQEAAEVLGELFTRAGHEVVTAEDGPRALEALDRFVPDVAFLDIGLPVMDGYELAARIRERLGVRTPPLVAVTGYGQAEDRARSHAAGFTRHVVKPVDAQSMLRAVQELGRPTA
jgi:CheY-like chemotaxis protein